MDLSAPDELRRRIDAVRERIAAACRAAGRPEKAVRLVVVTKTRPAALVQAVIGAGVADIGENRAQEIEEKAPRLKGAFSMHLIGHLQTNKINKVLPLVRWIQSIDSVGLIDAIDARKDRAGGPIDALVEVNTSGEAAKTGCPPRQCREVCERAAASTLLRLRGLMTVGPLTDDERAVRSSFAALRALGESCGDLTGGSIELSMGMSADFEWAIAEGATMVRIGSLILERAPHGGH